MSRSTSIIGLPREAYDFINEHSKKVTALDCPKCHHVISQKSSGRMWKDASDSGMFDDGPELYEYDLEDGRIVREEIQAIPWSSGPCIFLKLIDENGKSLFEWSQEEIDNV